MTVGYAEMRIFNHGIDALMEKIEDYSYWMFDDAEEIGSSDISACVGSGGWGDQSSPAAGVLKAVVYSVDPGSCVKDGVVIGSASDADNGAAADVAD